MGAKGGACFVKCRTCDEASHPELPAPPPLWDKNLGTYLAKTRSLVAPPDMLQANEDYLSVWPRVLAKLLCFTALKTCKYVNRKPEKPSSTQGTKAGEFGQRTMEMSLLSQLLKMRGGEAGKVKCGQIATRGA